MHTRGLFCALGAVASLSAASAFTLAAHAAPSAKAGTRAPGTPELISVTALGGGQVRVAWKDRSTNAAYFQIQRTMSACIPDPDEMKPGAPCPTTVVLTAFADQTEFDDVGVPDGITVSYSVAACDKTGCTGFSSQASVVLAPGKYVVRGTVTDRNLEPIAGAEVTIAQRSAWVAYGALAHLANPTQSQTITVSVQGTGSVKEIDVPCFVYVEGKSPAQTTVDVIHPDGTTARIIDFSYAYVDIGCSSNTAHWPQSPLNVFKGKPIAGAWKIVYQVTTADPNPRAQAQFGEVDIVASVDSQTAVSDSSGAYELSGIRYGDYVLSAAIDGKPIGEARSFRLAKDLQYQHFVGR